MYTGHISEVGHVAALDALSLEVIAPATAARLSAGDPIAVHGVNLVVAERGDERLRVHLSEETRHRSTLGGLAPGDGVNLETPLRHGAPVEGHLVQGNVSAVGKVLRVDDESPGRRVWIRPPRRTLDELRAKGSVALDGVSLTVAEISRDRFSVVLVPTTCARTTLDTLTPGRRVNIEPDVVTRVAVDAQARAAVSKLVSPRPWSGWVHGAAGVSKAVEQIAAGGAVVVWDPHREGEGDVIVAGERITPEHFVFVLTQACGHTTVPCAPEVLERLEIGPIPGRGDAKGTAMHCPVDIVERCIPESERHRFTGTGVSAFERAATVARLADSRSAPDDFAAPGHVFPLRAHPGGLAERQGHTEATVALCRAAGLAPVGICCEIMARDGRMAGTAELERLALEWELPLVGIDDLVRHL